jgi:hypothetical protein
VKRTLVFFRKSVEEITFLLKSDNNNGYFIWIHTYICENISLNPCYNEMFQAKVVPPAPNIVSFIK